MQITLLPPNNAVEDSGEENTVHTKQPSSIANTKWKKIYHIKEDLDTVQNQKVCQQDVPLDDIDTSPSSLFSLLFDDKLFGILTEETVRILVRE